MDEGATGPTSLWRESAAIEAGWQRDLATGSVAWSAGLRHAFGYTPEEVEPTFEWFAERVHPEDVVRVRSGIEAAIASDATRWSGTYRFRGADGRFVAVLDSALILRDARGRAAKTMGVLVTQSCDACGMAREVSALARAEEEIRRKSGYVKLLQAVAVAANEAETPEDALRSALRDVCALTGWAVGHARLMRRDVAAPAASTSLWYVHDPPKHGEFSRLSASVDAEPNSGVLQRILGSRGIWVSDLSSAHAPAVAEAARGLGLGFACAFSVLAGKEVAAVLEFFDFEPCEPEPQLLEVMRHVGTQLGRVMERHRATVALRASEDRLKKIFHASPAALAVLRLSDDRIIDANERFLALLEATRAEVLGKTPLELGVTAEPEQHRARLRALSAQQPVAEWELTLPRKSGEIREALGSSEPIEIDGAACALTSLVDITERKRAERALQHLALHDPLTDLPNRTLLFDRVQQAIGSARRQREPFAVLAVDLDDFKAVNDTFGHRTGDALLRLVAERLVATLRLTDTVARVGGDEFAVVLPRADEAGASLAAGKIVHALRRPFAVEGSTLEVAGSLGIALFPRDGEDADTLLRRADIALYVAKRSGSGHSVYSASDDRSEQVSAVAELRTALDRDELVIHVQPQVRPSSHAVVGMEALVRWRHPVRGVLLPEAFLAAAEPTGIMNRLTERVLAKALEQARRWEEAGHELVLAVNVSARNLLEVTLPDAVASALQDARVRPERLCLEITETLLMTDPERVAERLAKLRGLGVRISIDDFGTGYSSLAHLQRLPVEQLKVDKSFVRQLRSDRSAAAIVRAAVDLGHDLGLEIVAEGVEDRETCEELAAMGCDLAQGYYISPPLPADEIEAWLRDHR